MVVERRPICRANGHYFPATKFSHRWGGFPYICNRVSVSGPSTTKFFAVEGEGVLGVCRNGVPPTRVVKRTVTRGAAGRRGGVDAASTGLGLD